MRKAILEFEGENSDDSDDLNHSEIAALSWFTRVILEARTQKTAIPIIATLLLMTIVAIIAVLL